MRIVDKETGGVRGEIEGKARGGGVEGSEHGGGFDDLWIPLREQNVDLGWVEEVAEERRVAREAAGGQAAPAVGGEGSTEEVGE
jgi:hypothetical protein